MYRGGSLILAFPKFTQVTRATRRDREQRGEMVNGGGAERDCLDLTRSIDPWRPVVTLHGLCRDVVVVVVAVDIVVDIQRLSRNDGDGDALRP